MKFFDMFEYFGEKVVTKTDKSKHAYVLNKGQLSAVERSGRAPRQGELFDVIAFDGNGFSTVKASYYHSMRQEEGRVPEPRMGGEFIRDWLQVGERILIGNVGGSLYAVKIDGSISPEMGEGGEANSKIIEKALTASGPARTYLAERTEYVRNPYVVAAALIRSGGSCEFPGCEIPLFVTEAGRPYLEVHHLHPLSQGGSDSLDNVAALCPSCHRELHYGANRDEKLSCIISAIS